MTLLFLCQVGAAFAKQFNVGFTIWFEVAFLMSSEAYRSLLDVSNPPHSSPRRAGSASWCSFPQHLPLTLCLQPLHSVQSTWIHPGLSTCTTIFLLAAQMQHQGCRSPGFQPHLGSWRVRHFIHSWRCSAEMKSTLHAIHWGVWGVSWSVSSGKWKICAGEAKEFWLSWSCSPGSPSSWWIV